MAKLDKHNHQPHDTPQYNIRCLYEDPARPSDDPYSFHWRCRAWFPYNPDLPLHQRTYCPLHRDSDQVSQGEPVRAVPAEAKALMPRWPLRIPGGKPADDTYYEPTDEEIAWAREEIARQKALAGL